LYFTKTDGTEGITRACLAFKAKKMKNPLSQPIINTKPWVVRWDQTLAKRSCSTHTCCSSRGNTKVLAFSYKI